MVSKEDVISAVCSRPVLWDPAHVNRNEKVIVNSTWQEVARELKTNEDELRAKWSNLKAYYMKEIKRLEKRRLEDGPCTQSHWPYFSQMSFLTEITQEREPNNIFEDSYNKTAGGLLYVKPEEPQFCESDTSTISFHSPKPTDALTDERKQDDNESIGESDSTIPFLKDNALIGESDSTIPPCPHPNSKCSNTIACKRKQDDEMVVIAQKKVYRTECNTEDDDMMFFRSLLSDFKSLPRESRLLLKFKYVELLYNEVRSRTNVPKT
ncbi:hypothetical protein L9F63_005652 [Diploptera punctata]|uniref:Transcription factor Adf-1 n=1 Tax=Diploptera punctata TaxID=6984 RepID=A0AAD7ZCC7_DIPPU|nr:hypothetical protein L9F63_005652 [Diploptera punctata]